MEIKNLKIGNIVVDSSGNYYAIEEIKRDNDNIIYKKGEYRLVAKLLNSKCIVVYEDLVENFCPVLLTEEILLKCENITKTNGYPYKILNRFIKIRNGVFFFKNYDLEIELPYLHTLQNLYFSLTGEELNIEL